MCAVELSYKLIERMNLFDLELAYQMLLTEKQINNAATKISSIWRGVTVRKRLVNLINKRKWATLILQRWIRYKQWRQRMRIIKSKAAVIVQRYLRSYLVLKRFIKLRGDFVIMNNLAGFEDMKLMVADRL